MNDTEQAKLSKRGAGGRATAAMYAARTECRRGHPLTPKNTYSTKLSPRLCRTCQRLGWKKQHKEGKLGPGTIRKIFERLHEGQPLCSINGRRMGSYVGDAIISSTQLYNFMNKNPRIAKRIRKLADINRRTAFREAWAELSRLPRS